MRVSMTCPTSPRPQYGLRAGISAWGFDEKMQSVGGAFDFTYHGVGRLYNYRDERGFPLTQYITNGGISRARNTITHFNRSRPSTIVSYLLPLVYNYVNPIHFLARTHAT